MKSWASTPTSIKCCQECASKKVAEKEAAKEKTDAQAEDLAAPAMKDLKKNKSWFPEGMALARGNYADADKISKVFLVEHSWLGDWRYVSRFFFFPRVVVPNKRHARASHAPLSPRRTYQDFDGISRPDPFTNAGLRCQCDPAGLCVPDHLLGMLKAYSDADADGSSRQAELGIFRGVEGGFSPPEVLLQSQCVSRGCRSGGCSSPAHTHLTLSFLLLFARRYDQLALRYPVAEGVERLVASATLDETGTEWVFSPAVCVKCSTTARENMSNARSVFDEKTINIVKLKAGAEPPTDPSAPVGGGIDSGSRRSTRTRNSSSKASFQITVSSSTKLGVVKVKIFEKMEGEDSIAGDIFSVQEGKGCLTLTDDDQTLAEAGVLAGSTLHIRVVKATAEDLDQQLTYVGSHDVTADVEYGFGGTMLQSSSVAPSAAAAAAAASAATSEANPIQVDAMDTGTDDGAPASLPAPSLSPRGPPAAASDGADGSEAQQSDSLQSLPDAQPPLKRRRSNRTVPSPSEDAKVAQIMEVFDNALERDAVMAQLVDANWVVEVAIERLGGGSLGSQ